MIYADNAATTKMSDAAISAIVSLMQDTWGNPSSLYSVGQTAKEALEEAREDIAAVRGASRGRKLRYLYAHYVLGACLKSDLLLRRHQRSVERLLGHNRARVNEVSVAVGKLLLNRISQRAGFSDQVKKLTHKLVALILEHFMTANGCGKLFFELSELHSRWIYIHNCHTSTCLLFTVKFVSGEWRGASSRYRVFPR